MNQLGKKMAIVDNQPELRSQQQLLLSIALIRSTAWLLNKWIASKLKIELCLKRMFYGMATL